MRILIPFVAVLLAAPATGCFVEYDNNSRRAPPPNTQTPAPTPPPAETPRVVIDTGRTLEAQPGGGVGLFITYAGAGNWNLKWTCDTNLVPRHSCNFEIGVGTRARAKFTNYSPSMIAQSDETSFIVRTITTTTLDTIGFQIEPGEPIALTMRIDGQVWPNLIWYVSDGKLSKAPSDPLELVPSAP